MIGNVHFTLPTTKQDSLNIWLFRIDIQNILKQKQTLDSKVGNNDVYLCSQTDPCVKHPIFDPPSCELRCWMLFVCSFNTFHDLCFSQLTSGRWDASWRSWWQAGLSSLATIVRTLILFLQLDLKLAIDIFSYRYYVYENISVVCFLNVRPDFQYQNGRKNL